MRCPVRLEPLGFDTQPLGPRLSQKVSRDLAELAKSSAACPPGMRR